MSRMVRGLTIVGAALTLAAFTGAAQAQSGAGPRGDRVGQRAARADALNLTDTQREQIRKLREDHRAALREPMQQLRDARRQWHAEMAADQPDGGRLQQLRSEVLRLSLEVEASRLQLREQRLSILTPEQRQILRERGDVMRDGGGAGRHGKGMRRPGGRR
jgi:Spy/CpxP family protein refolding chaperone